MKLENILFDMGFTLITLKNFDMRGYLKNISKNIDQLQKHLIEKGIIFNENFSNILKQNQKEYFLKAHKSDTEFSTEFIIESSFKEIGLEPEKITNELIDESANIIYSEDSEFWIAYPDVESTLKILKNKGFKLAIVSNAPWHKGVLQMLQSNDIDGYFDLIVSSASVKVRKPNPEIFNFVLSKLEADISNSVFIGDDLYCDIYGAKNLGLKTIYFDKGFDLPYPRKINVIPDQTVKKISDIPKILENWNKNL